MKNKVESQKICRVCGCKEVTHVFNWLGFEWFKCSACGSVMKDITYSEYENLNPTYDPGQYSNDLHTEEQLREVLDVKNKVERLGNLIDTGKGRAFLDIGCGMGGYLLAARDMDYSVTGIEPSGEHSQVASDLAALEIFNGYYSHGVLKSQFDVVMLSHVIEHIYIPGDFLESIMLDILPGGRLIIITPNTASLASRLTGKYWSMYKPVDHVTMLTRKGLQAICPGTAEVEYIGASEWSGEFAALCLSALKTFIKPPVEANKQTSGLIKITVTQQSLSNFKKVLLAIVSWPFKVAGKILDQQACITVVYRKIIS